MSIIKINTIYKISALYDWMKGMQKSNQSATIKLVRFYGYVKPLIQIILLEGI
jgi:hypothetical protein